MLLCFCPLMKDSNLYIMHTDFPFVKLINLKGEQNFYNYISVVGFAYNSDTDIIGN